MSHHPSSSRGTSRSQHRRGQALIEFAFVAIVSVMLVTGLMAVLVMALGSFQNNIATENAGRELDGHPLFIKENFVTHFTLDPDDPDPFYGDDDFENVTARQVYRFLTEYPVVVDGPVLYDESWLILSEADWINRANLPLPAINRSLLGQYIFDPDLEFDGQEERGGFRFPGAVVTNPTGNRTVMIPLLQGPKASGIGRTFNITSTDPDFFYPVSQNWVAPVVIGKDQDGNGFEFRVIMFHPSQPAALQYVDNQLVEADDSAVAIGAPPTGYALLQDPLPINPKFDGSSTSRGEFGLGELGIGGGTVGPDGTTPAIPPRKIRPFRMVFETSSLFRMGAPLYAVKYEADESSIPFPALNDESLLSNSFTADTPVTPFVAYEDNDDQSLDFERRVIDHFSDERRRYFVNFPIVPPASSDNDFVANVLQLLPNDDGVWRVSVAARFETIDGSPWEVNHVLQLWLYMNGVRRSLITTHNVTSGHSTAISLTGQTLIKAAAADVLQVRVFTKRETGSYEVRLTGDHESNWVSFERVRD